MFLLRLHLWNTLMVSLRYAYISIDWLYGVFNNAYWVLGYKFPHKNSYQ